ncbi:3-oxo-tetronate kinase [Herbiconiux sp. 11R-BC]|uniref:3-oxo-tetronate kinase n=1 Tax=Herbiconiux sp. 11R-BC TaxID=3111637 RepID=UPI003C0175F6
MIGAIADDYTGGTDVAVAFRRAGLRTVLLFGEPSDHVELPEHDAVVVALKSRTIAPAEAVRMSLASASWLKNRGVGQFYFKYCSTFDSRPEGNIGPVADALAGFLGASRVVVAPSSPEHLRTQYLGHLFVDRQLLSESPMRHHPLTPMTDSFIPRVLAAQTAAPVSLIDERDVRRGRARIRSLLDERGPSDELHYVVVDAITDGDLREIGAACADELLVTGAAGLAGGLGAARAARLGAVQPVAVVGDRGPGRLRDAGPGAVLAGSCSARTLQQVAHMAAAHPSFRLDALSSADAGTLAEEALRWYDRQDAAVAPLVYSSLPPRELAEVQAALGTEQASDLLETAMGLVARGLVRRGVRRIVVAGGETSGAVVSALEVDGGVIGEEAAPGVPWIYSTGPDPVALLLKSGNFGEVELLSQAIESPLSAAPPATGAGALDAAAADAEARS